MCRNERYKDASMDKSIALLILDAISGLAAGTRRDINK
jgi:hypothetical protein